MSRTNKLLHLIFAVIVIVELTGRLIDNVLLEYPVKPLIMIWITLYFLLNARKRTFRNGVLLAFFFSWTGDIFLMFSGGYDNEMLFYTGVGGFFLAQVTYIFIFLLNAENDIKGLLLRNPLWFIPLLGYGVLIYWLLYPGLEGVMVPVILVYALSLIGMSLAALNRRDRVNYSSFRLVFAGSLFFVASDSMIAINKFHTEIPYAGFLIMLTYIIAQYLIMRGLILEKPRPASNNQ
ncbi:MAG: lysoplasmalogenase [Bacteroidales bacterium]|nr:lysoplasmalogenase [Bacteroidales bacterium]MDT8432469.1 lysoplasmalogenase [Bacteroidales bacterium]